MEFTENRIYNRVCNENGIYGWKSETFRVNRIDSDNYAHCDTLFSELSHNVPTSELAASFRICLDMANEGKSLSFEDVTENPEKWIVRSKVATIEEIVEYCGIEQIKKMAAGRFDRTVIFHHTGKNENGIVLYGKFHVNKANTTLKTLILSCNSENEFKAEVRKVLPNAWN